MRGLAWALRVVVTEASDHRPLTPVAVVAVTGSTVSLRGIDGKWRMGHYMNDEEASAYAVRITQSYEDSMHGTLIGGPSDFEYSESDPTVNDIASAAAEALGLRFDSESGLA